MKGLIIGILMISLIFLFIFNTMNYQLAVFTCDKYEEFPYRYEGENKVKTNESKADGYAGFCVEYHQVNYWEFFHNIKHAVGNSK